MKKLKKGLVLCLSVIMLLSTLAACGGEKKPSDDEKQQKEESENASNADDELSEKTESKEEDDEPASDSRKFEGVSLTYLKDTETNDAGFQAVIDLAEEKLGMDITVEHRPGGTEGDNIVKTRLASGEMTDICFYNSGSLFKALNPSKYFIDLSDQPFVEKYTDDYLESVSYQGGVFGVPIQPSQAGAILYNKSHYEKYGLEVPHTWEQFLKNCEILKEAGETAVISSFAETWTTQVPFLGDHYNVLAAEPDFAERFEAGEAKYADTPIGLESWKKIQDVSPYFNEDYMATGYYDAADKLIMGEGTHYIILTQIFTSFNELYSDEEINNIGVFGIPGDDPEDHGLTMWMSNSIYGNKNTENPEAVLAFMEFCTTDEALDAYTSAVSVEGPFPIKGYKLPETAPDAIRIDMQSYIDSGKTKPAMEFQTPVKGPNCEKFTQELGSGQTTPEEAAAGYDEDCRKQALQLGLDWD